MRFKNENVWICAWSSRLQPSTGRKTNAKVFWFLLFQVLYGISWETALK